MSSFIDILSKYSSKDTSFGTDKNTVHSYGPVYESYFSTLKDKASSILEIGFDSGASLEAYSEYFTNAMIYGIDIRDNTNSTVKYNPRIRMKFGDATSYDIITYFNKTYDIIIEDASHLLEHQIQHFKDYIKFVKPGGYYIIEDVHENNLDTLVSTLNTLYDTSIFNMEVVDLRYLKNRFDDILIIFKRIQ